MRRLAFSLATGLLLAGCSTVSTKVPIAAAPQPLAADIPTQLPRLASPSHYAITITPDAAARRFAGQSSVDLTVFEPTNSIVMNANALEISRATLTRIDGPAGAANAAPRVMTVATDAAAQTASFRSDAVIEPGRYRLDTTYTGTINTQANGLFSLDYPDKRDGSPKRGLFTQFQAPDARRFAPMFDEPSYKATFDLTAVVPENQMAVSNMPAAREERLGDGRKRVTFATTPRMSSYLLFFALGEFERMAMPAAPGVEAGIVSPVGSGEQARFALESLAPLVPYFNDYFGQDYPLPKLDNVAGPGQSQFFGAMENWGAIFTFERILLNDPANTSATTRTTIFEVQAHEVAHQWFGDLVTMAWWDDLWLNEGFASWMATKATDHFHPEWFPLLDRVGGREAAIGLDSLATTHPIVQPIRTVEETNQAFDTITYQKGEAVVAMLEAYAGEDVWRSGLRRYMAEHRFGNAKTADLWRAVEAAGARNLVGIAQDFTTKPGVPLVRVESARCEGGRTVLGLTQGEYSVDRREAVAANPQSWRVPVVARTVGAAPTRSVLQGRGSMTLAGCGAPLVNAGQLGYYRTLYTPAALAQLTAAYPQLEPIDQLGLLRDQMALSGTAYQPYAPALNLLAAVPADANPVVAGRAISTYAGLYNTLEGNSAAQAKLAALATRQFGTRLQSLGFAPRAGEPLVDDQLRSTMIASLGAMGDRAVLAEADRLFARLGSDPRALDGPLKTTWLSIIARNASPAQFDQLLALARRSTSVVEKSTYYSLLGTARDPRLADRALRLAVTDEPGATTSAAIIGAVGGTNSERAVDFFLANQKAIAPLVDASARTQFLARLAGGSRDPATITKLEAYAKGVPADEARPLRQTITALQQSALLRPRTVAGVTEWLATR